MTGSNQMLYRLLTEFIWHILQRVAFGIRLLISLRKSVRFGSFDKPSKLEDPDELNIFNEMSVSIGFVELNGSIKPPRAGNKELSPFTLGGLKISPPKIIAIKMCSNIWINTVAFFEICNRTKQRKFNSEYIYTI